MYRDERHCGPLLASRILVPAFSASSIRLYILGLGQGLPTWGTFVLFWGNIGVGENNYYFIYNGVLFYSQIALIPVIIKVYVYRSRFFL